MDPTYSAEAEAYREKIQAFLAEHLPAGWKGIGALPDGRGRGRSPASGARSCTPTDLLAASWPQEYGGGGLSDARAGDPGRGVLPGRACRPATGNDVFGIQMVGNTILQWGTDEQKAHFLPRILSGEDLWCQGYSEPNAGSDLGNLGCRAELDGDEWVINGQKIWTSAGHLANWIFVLARTDPDVAQAQGHQLPARARWTSPASRSGRSR